MHYLFISLYFFMILSYLFKLCLYLTFPPIIVFFLFMFLSIRMVIEYQYIYKLYYFVICHIISVKSQHLHQELNFQ